MLKKIYRYLCIIIFCFLALIGCTKQDFALQLQDLNENTVKTSEKVVPGDQIKNDLEFLTSEECDGRKPGTLGNKKAATYIANRFEDIGLVPLLEDYRHSYIKQTESLDSDKISLEILDNGKTRNTFVYGEDYTVLFIDASTLILPLLLEPKDTECAVLVEDITTAQKYLNNPKVRLILRKDTGSSRGGYFYQEGATPQLRVYQETYDQLIKNVGKEISFSCDINIEEKTQDSIVGVMKGKESKNALIISAHYDHLGSAGERIWRGALDNASGVCLLLETAKTIKEYYKENFPVYDIIFCAFNSEENGMDGSRNFAELMNEKYQRVFNINLDCIGNKNFTSLFVHRNNSETSELICDDLIDSMSAAGIVPIMKSHGDYSSDQVSFADGIVLTTISNIQSSSIHTLDDTPDNIDTEYLLHLAGALGNYITNDMEIEELFESIRQEDENKGNEKQSYEYLRLTKDEFENIFDYKLSFVDEALSSINIYNWRPLIQANTSQEEMKDKSIQDIRNLVLELDFDKNFIMGPEVRLMCITYKKDDPLEMEIKQYELISNGYSEEVLSNPISIWDTNYYIPEGDSGISTFVENEEYYLWISVNIINLFKFDEEPTRDELIEKYKEKLPIVYIEGMAELLLHY